MNKTPPPASIDDPLANALLRDAIEALAEGLAVYDAAHRLVTFNQPYARMLAPIADLLVPGATWEDLIHAGAQRGLYADAVGREEAWYQEQIDLGIPFGESHLITQGDGTAYIVKLHPTSAGGFVITRSEITEQRRAEMAAREREAILRTVLEASPVAIVMARLKDGKIVFRSADAEAHFGPHDNAVQNYRRPEDRQAYIRDLLAHGRVDNYELPLRDKDGKAYFARCSGRLTELDGEPYVVTVSADLSAQVKRDTMIRRVLEACPTPIQMTRADSGEVLFSSPETINLFGDSATAQTFYADPETRAHYLGKLRKDRSVTEYKAEYINAHGRRFWGAVSARLIDYDGEEVIVSHTRDLTNQLRIEQELAAQQELGFQNEKMSALGGLLAGVAHELNNPLSVVVGHSMMLCEDATDPDVLRQARKISAAADRCSRIVRTFLTIARQKPSVVEAADINEIVRTAVDVARYGDRAEDIDVTLDVDRALPPVPVDPDQITQVIVSLILNAEHAIAKSGKGSVVRVTTRAGATPDTVEIVVEDDGPGIPPAIRQRIFEPFFTTKQVGEGTGIGLALSHRIVRSHDGQITVDKHYRDGSRFVIRLPVSATAPLPGVPEPAAEDAPASTRVLVIDDEADVAELNAEILSRDGYDVAVACTPDAALDLIGQGEFDVVLSDLNMPELDGRGVYDLIRRDRPDMLARTGFITGDTMGQTSQTFLKEAGQPYIEKPVSPRDLRAFVARLLAANG